MKDQKRPLPPLSKAAEQLLLRFAEVRGLDKSFILRDAANFVETCKHTPRGTLIPRILVSTPAAFQELVTLVKHPPAPTSYLIDCVTHPQDDITIRPLRNTDARNSFASGDVDADEFFRHWALRTDLQRIASHIATSGRHILAFATVTASTITTLPQSHGISPQPERAINVLRLARLAEDQNATQSGAKNALLAFHLRIADTTREVGVLADVRPEAVEAHEKLGFTRIECNQSGSLDDRLVPMFLTTATIRAAQVRRT